MIKKRESNLELCRIITMVIIVFNHIVSLGETIDKETLNMNTMLSLFLLLGGKFGTNVFVIIGIYFLTNSEFKFIRVAKLWCQTLFYMIMLNFVDIVFFNASISFKVWIKSFLPIIGRSYWFVSSYIILLLLIPVLNKLYTKLNIRKLHIICGIILFSLFPTVTFNGNLFAKSIPIRFFFKLIMFGPVWFSFLYILIKYIKEQMNNSWLSSRSVKFYFLFWIASYGLMYLIEVELYRKGIRGDTFSLENYSDIRDMSSLLCLLAAGSFFIIFNKINISYNRIINYIASDMFGVFLLHNHESSIPIFWKGIFDLDIISKLLVYPLYCCFIVILVFIAGILIEFIRKKVEKSLLNNSRVIRAINWADRRMNKIYSTFK